MIPSFIPKPPLFICQSGNLIDRYHQENAPKIYLLRKSITDRTHLRLSATYLRYKSIVLIYARDLIMQTLSLTIDCARNLIWQF